MGLWLLHSLRDVRWALGRAATFLNHAAPAADSSGRIRRPARRHVQLRPIQLVFTDPPDNTRLRRLVIAAFVPSVINELAAPVGDDHEPAAR
jgi:cytochrome P450